MKSFGDLLLAIALMVSGLWGLWGVRKTDEFYSGCLVGVGSCLLLQVLVDASFNGLKWLPSDWWWFVYLLAFCVYLYFRKPPAENK